jgi:microcystin-dependent protein
MDPSYLGAIWFFGSNFAPVNFALCDGALMPISQNEALYAVLGTTYGGDGVNTFALPDLRGRGLISQGQGPGLSSYQLGQLSGSEAVTLTVSNLASHSHLVNAGTNATAQAPTSSMYINQVMSGSNAEIFFSNATPNDTLAATTISTAGSSLPVSIVQPVLAVTCIIALYGIFPSQN